MSLINQKVTGVKEMLSLLGMEASMKDCNETNYKRYIQIILRNAKSNIKRINVNTRKVTIDKIALRIYNEMKQLFNKLENI
jgi:hypothetical protein